MSDFDNNDNGKVTLNDANKAKSGYASEADIAKRTFEFDTQEPNENPVNEEPERPSERPTTSLGAKIENQDELFSGIQTQDGQDFETADESVEMMSEQEFNTDRDVRWTSKEAMDRGEYETKTDAEVAKNMGLEDMPEADQSERDPITEKVDRRPGESLAMYEKRVGEEVDHARMDERARVVAEPTTPPVEEGGDVECPVDDVKYAAAWFDADEEPEADEMSPSRERAESSKVEAAAMSEAQRAEVEERAKLAAGLEPDEAWSPIERIGEEIMELGQHVDRVAAKAGITKKQALTILCEKRLETGSAAKAAMKAAGDARNYFKSAPAPITEVHHRQYTTTVEGEVTHLFTPMNSNEHQVALIEDTLTGNSFKFLIHERTRRSRAWTEWNGEEIVTDLREGDVVKIIDGKPHWAGGGDVGVKIHASSWTVIQRKERGDGKFVTRNQPRDRVIEQCDLDLPESLEGPAVKNPEAYNTNKSKLDQRRAKKPNGAESNTSFERRETCDPTLVQWAYPVSWVPEQHMHHYKVEEKTGETAN